MALISPIDEPEKTIYGRVYFYDDTNKTLILKIVDPETFKATKQEHIIGMGVYNTANIIERGFDFTVKALSVEEYDQEFQAGDVSKNSDFRDADKTFKTMLKDQANK
jgi:hypothetical protein